MISSHGLLENNSEECGKMVSCYWNIVFPPFHFHVPLFWLTTYFGKKKRDKIRIGRLSSAIYMSWRISCLDMHHFEAVEILEARKWTKLV